MLIQVCSQFNKNDTNAPFEVCSSNEEGDCIERCAFNIPESELKVIEECVKEYAQVQVAITLITFTTGMEGSSKSFQGSQKTN